LHQKSKGAFAGKAPSCFWLRFGGHNIPAREVGGDFYDLIIQDENIQFVIADVSGKGVPAALFMALSRTIVRACASTHGSVSERLSCAII